MKSFFFWKYLSPLLWVYPCQSLWKYPCKLMEIICIIEETIWYTRKNIFVYLWKYLCKLVEILRRTIWRVVCAQECPANCKPVADIVFMHLLPLPARLQKRPNWGIKHNKSQNSRANFSGERGEMALLCICWCSCAYTWCGVECRCLCLHLEKKGTLEDSGGARWWDTCKLFPGIISSLNKTALSPTTTCL